jgi:hypothetical protein
LRLSEAEIERRKSLELIQQRWFSAQPVEPLKTAESVTVRPYTLDKADEGQKGAVESSVIASKLSEEPISSSEDKISASDAVVIADTTEISDPPSPPSSAAASFSASTEGSLRPQGSYAAEPDAELDEAGDDSEAKATAPRVRVSFDLGKNIHYEIADLDESSFRDASFVPPTVGIEAQVAPQVDIGNRVKLSDVSPLVEPPRAFDAIVQEKNPYIQKVLSNDRKPTEPIADRASNRSLPLPGSGSFEAKMAPALEMVVPSIDDLHAQLAAIKAAEKRRKESRMTKQPAPIPPNNAPFHERKRKSVSPPPPPLPSSSPEWDSLSRLEQSNARLNRQFDELNNEIRQLRGGVLNKFVAKPVQDAKKSRPSANAGPRDDRSALGSRVPSQPRAPGAAAAGPAVRAEEEQPRPVFRDWDDDALSYAKDIVKANAELKQKVSSVY